MLKLMLLSFPHREQNNPQNTTVEHSNVLNIFLIKTQKKDSKMLNQNHKDMKTVVETFIIEETAELIYDNEKLEKWNQLKSELGLVGQDDILRVDKSPVPFQPATKIQMQIIEVLCPKKDLIEAYRNTPIPLEVLELVSLSVKEGYFEKIHIHYDAVTPDPFAIGYRYKDEDDRAKGYTWNMQPYLIAKWGDVKQSWDTLKERAASRWISEEAARLKEKLRETQRSIEDLRLTCLNKFGENSETVNVELPF